MKPLFTIELTNIHQSLLFKDQTKLESIVLKLNRLSLLSSWTAPDLTLRTVHKHGKIRPNISALVNLIAVRADLLHELFPSPSSDFEFLPARVDDEDWIILNCLRSVEEYDERESQVFRGLNGDAFLVLRLRITDPTAHQYEAFTLACSNRSQLFVRSSFRDRFLKSNLEGITLREIGEIA